MLSNDAATNLYLLQGFFALLALAAWMLKGVFIGFVLQRAGISTRATVQRCVERRIGNGPYYLVFYEFNTTNRNGARTYTGFHRSALALKKNDIVAIQYWSRFPGVSRMYDRAM